jgi:hypothetical protein
MPSKDDRLHRFILEGFRAEDIAEGLISFDANHEARALRDSLRTLDYDLVGIRSEGVVAGYARREDLITGRCGDFLRPFTADMVIPGRTSLGHLIPRVGDGGYQFVVAFGAVAGIITLADLQKPPVRMWMFGLITMLEESFARWIVTHFPDDAWTQQLSASRIEAAQRLQAERMRRNESLALVDCLQLADKARILLKNAEVRERLGIPSNTAARRAVKNLEQLRNRLAHAQDIVTPSLTTMVNLALRLDTVLEVYSAPD